MEPASRARVRTCAHVLTIAPVAQPNRAVDLLRTRVPMDGHTAVGRGVEPRSVELRGQVGYPFPARGQAEKDKVQRVGKKLDKTTICRIDRS